MNNLLASVKADLKKQSDPLKKEFLPRFFKTGKGQYGEGDVFWGVTVPKIRKIAKKYKDLPLQSIKKLLSSKIHEMRLLALLILIHQYERADESNKEKMYRFYLHHTKGINNWDLVDLSAPRIVGDYLSNIQTSQGLKILSLLAASKNIWKRRIAIISTYTFIRKNRLEETFLISKILLSDSHDLIHKAVGWMLRETGKNDQERLEKFLKDNYKNIPRTTLRYAIERFDQEKRRNYLTGSF